MAGTHESESESHPPKVKANVVLPLQSTYSIDHHIPTTYSECVIRVNLLSSTVVSKPEIGCFDTAICVQVRLLYRVWKQWRVKVKERK